jgi:hypothetical protein
LLPRDLMFVHLENNNSKSHFKGSQMKDDLGSVSLAPSDDKLDSQVE